MVFLSQRDERHPATVPTRIGPTVGLTSPQMTDGIDAERGVQNQKDPPGSGHHETAHAAYPVVGEVPDEKRQCQSGQEKWNVPAVLPHHQIILSQPGRISFGPVRAFREEPGAVAVPKSFRRVVEIFLLVHTRMVPGVIGTPFSAPSSPSPSCPRPRTRP